MSRKESETGLSKRGGVDDHVGDAGPGRSPKPGYRNLGHLFSIEGLLSLSRKESETGLSKLLNSKPLALATSSRKESETGLSKLRVAVICNPLANVPEGVRNRAIERWPGPESYGENVGRTHGMEQFNPVPYNRWVEYDSDPFAIDSIANPHLNADSGTIIAFKDEMFGLACEYMSCAAL